MKELSIEEKAKRYDNRLKKAKEWYNLNTNEGYKGIFEDIFPELVESEDARIRKEILDCFRAMKQQGCFPSKHKEQYDSWIAWLEKQGEKLPVGFYYVNSEGKKFYSDTFKYGDVILHIEKQGEQKPAWSEEDDDNMMLIE